MLMIAPVSGHCILVTFGIFTIGTIGTVGR